MIAISSSDYKKYGCPDCGCLFAPSQGMYVTGTYPVTCGECHLEFVILSDGCTESSITFGSQKEKPILEEHPRKGLWPHEMVRPDIKPRGIDGEFWSPRGVGYDLSGFVMCKDAGERIIQMVKEVIGRKPRTWLDYRPSEPLWIQVKIQKEDGFDLKALNEACKDGVINEARLHACFI